MVCYKHTHESSSSLDFLFSWYKRSELGTRVAIFFSAATVSGAFGKMDIRLRGVHISPPNLVIPGGLLAAAISNMNGIGGRPGWAWIFILEGLFTILAGLASFWIIQDFPDTAKFLTETESALKDTLFYLFPDIEHMYDLKERMLFDDYKKTSNSVLLARSLIKDIFGSV